MSIELRKMLLPLASIALMAPLGINANTVANARARRAPRRGVKRVYRNRAKRGIRRARHRTPRVRYRARRYYHRAVRPQYRRRARINFRRGQRGKRMNHRIMRNGALGYGRRASLKLPKHMHLTHAQRAALYAGEPVKGLSHRKMRALKRAGINNQMMASVNHRALRHSRMKALRIPSEAHLNKAQARAIRHNKVVKGLNSRQQNVLSEYGIPVANNQKPTKSFRTYRAQPISANAKAKAGRVAVPSEGKARRNADYNVKTLAILETVSHKGTPSEKRQARKLTRNFKGSANQLVDKNVNARNKANRLFRKAGRRINHPSTREFEDSAIYDYNAKNFGKDYANLKKALAKNGVENGNTNKVPNNPANGNKSVQNGAKADNGSGYNALENQKNMKNSKASNGKVNAIVNSAADPSKLGHNRNYDLEFLMSADNNALKQMEQIGNTLPMDDAAKMDNALAYDVDNLQSSVTSAEVSDGILPSSAAKNVSSASAKASSKMSGETNSSKASTATSAVSNAVNIQSKNNAKASSKAKSGKDNLAPKIASGTSKIQKSGNDDVMKATVDNTPGLTSAEKSAVINYLSSHQSAIANPTLDKNAPKSASSAIKKMNKIAGVPTVSSKSTSSATSSAESSAVKKDDAATGRVTGMPGLNDTEMEALHDNYEAMMGNASTQTENANHDDHVSDIEDVNGSQLRVPYVSNNSSALYDKPDVTPGAKQVVTQKALTAHGNKDVAHTFMVFQTAKGSNGDTYYHVISFDGSHTGWINASALKKADASSSKVTKPASNVVKKANQAKSNASNGITNN